MHNTSHAIKVKKTSHDRFAGAICIGACLAQGYAPQNLWLVDLQGPPARPSPPSE
jgi:hypothetical protein